MNQRGVTNCHYADDTIFFLTAIEENVESTWWAMMAFEALSGIKMNYDKTIMYPINISNNSHLNQLFRCPWGNFPFSYLGLPLSPKKLTLVNWQFLVDKVEYRLPSWKCHLLSMGGKLTLVNSVLSSILLYTLSVYKISVTIINRIDKVRRQFLWQCSNRAKRKYILIKWSVACLAKQLGGMGILNLRDMNVSLLLKWWWKLKNPSYSSTWKTLILKKYHLATNSPKSPFYNAISTLDTLGNVSVSYDPGTNSQIKFREDLWYQNYSLATAYPSCTNHVFKRTSYCPQWSILRVKPYNL